MAAAFRGTALLDAGLPVRLRDIASHLTSSVRAEQKSVGDDDLLALSQADAEVLVTHLAAVARDRPTAQRAAVTGLLRVARICPSSIAVANTCLSRLPAGDLEPATILAFRTEDVAHFDDVLVAWHGQGLNSPARAALEKVRGDG